MADARFDERPVRDGIMPGTRDEAGHLRIAIHREAGTQVRECSGLEYQPFGLE